jgi:hypothetical protein
MVNDQGMFHRVPLAKARSFVPADDKVDQFLEEGGLRWLVELASSSILSVKKHAGLALYSLAKNGEYFISLAATRSSKSVQCLENKLQR